MNTILGIFFAILFIGIIIEYWKAVLIFLGIFVAALVGNIFGGIGVLIAVVVYIASISSTLAFKGSGWGNINN